MTSASYIYIFWSSFVQMQMRSHPAVEMARSAVEVAHCQNGTRQTRLYTTGSFKVLLSRVTFELQHQDFSPHSKSLNLSDSVKLLDILNASIISIFFSIFRKCLIHYGLQSQIGWLNQKKNFFLIFWQKSL